uniref:Uncharacterized protein n=1 Tax=Fagus sylvatica TaxID=28930 RepID=A0A2N9GMM5_FAGSY
MGWGFKWEKQIGAGMLRWVFAVRSVRRCDGGIGATAWLGLAGHELGERESEQRERKRAENRPGCWGWLGWLGTVRKRAETVRRA